MIKNSGYDKLLFILPFDHRSSFEKSVFGQSDLTSFEKQEIVLQKQIIYEAFKKAVSENIPPADLAAILVDEQYGEAILRDAKERGFNIVLTTEESGQNEFIFEYGQSFKEHIEKHKPKFVKALFHQKELKESEKENFLLLSDFAHSNDYKFLLEIICPDVSDEEKARLIVKTISNFQNLGIEPDIWKVEGMEDHGLYGQIVEQAKADSRANVGIIILGKGEGKDMVERWIVGASKIDGVIGFAIGRTVFVEPLNLLRDGKISKEKAIEQIAKNYQYFYNLFMQ